MKNRWIKTWAALNLILLIGLALVEISPELNSAQARTPIGDTVEVQVRAQDAPARQIKRDYIMVAGKVRGRSRQDAIYIIEQRSGLIAVLFHDSTTKKTIYLGRKGPQKAQPEPPRVRRPR